MRRRGPVRTTICSTAAVLITLLALPTGVAAEPALPEGFQDEVVFGGLEQPTNFSFAADGRVFVAEKPGRILVFDDLEDATPDVFADLRADVYDNGDRGLLGLELDPEFTTGRPYVYALYTWDHVLGQPWDPEEPEYGTPGVSGDPGCPSQNSSASCLVSGRLVRLTENLLDPNHAVEEGGLPKEEELLQGWCQQFSSHSVGELQFGPEGALYVSGGDGAAYESIPDWGQLGTPPNPCGDPPSPAGTTPSPMSASKGGALRAQNLEVLNGAILRLDPDTGAAFEGNPLAASGDENTRRTVAKGFRNPFRFTFDSASGEIYTGNVGSSEIEEIERFEAPPKALYNSGWPCYEGIQRQFQFKNLGLNVCNAMYSPNPNPTSLPLFSYSHKQTVVPEDECPTESGSAVGGISLYEGTQLPAPYQGALFFADAVRGCIWAMLAGEDGKPDPATIVRFLREGKVYPGVKISEGPGEYLYYANLLSEEGVGDGEIHRIAYRPNSPTARLEAEPPFGLYDSGGDFETLLDASKSTDPTSDPLTYEWDLDEDGVFEISGSEETQTLIFTEAEQEEREDDDLSPNRVIAVRVEDDESFSSVARITVYPGDKPPTVTITEPAAGFQWGVGDEIDLNASAVDSNGNGIFEPLPYYWVTRMAHCPDPANPTACHVHPLQTFSGIKHAEFVAPQHDYPSYIDVVLRVSDKRGLSGTATLKINPRTVNLSLTSNPPGIPLLAASTEATSPFSVPAIDGSEILISAPPTAVLGGRTYTFAGWSDGGAREHPIVVSSAQTGYTASYTTPGGPPSPVPNTKLGRHPRPKSAKTTATFTFSSNVAGAGFRCKLDGRAKARCRSPKTYRKLKPGRHTFKVWATAGILIDPTPARFSWKILPR
ncbi:MAG TPA: PQQ-dependent sugar dehydrogenase [Solirubrobacterales bacterium]|nr:PQQ-dependent sugar dehydrogenase [Solirubrobacterales bacterium]